MPPQRRSTLDEVVKTVKRFRILCVGRAGVGKSSVINRVFGVKAAHVENWKKGKADIQKGFTSTDNDFFVLHDSEGFEPGVTGTFDTVRQFIEQRAKKDLPLEERLHAVWLCTQAPKAGGRVFETGDEKLLRLAHQTQTPVVVVFTKYDQLIRSKKAELQEKVKGLSSEDLDKQSKQASQDVLEVCVQSLKNAIGRMDSDMHSTTATQMPPWVKISIIPGYNADIAFLVDVTGDLVRAKLEPEVEAADARLMWTIAQRASLPLKIEACIHATMVYCRKSLADGQPRSEQTSLRQLLASVHEDIVTCWNFRDKENILRGEALKKLIFLLVQDVEESRNQAPSQAIDDISQVLSVITDTAPHNVPDPALAGTLENLLSDTVSSNQAQAQRLFMTYAVVLTTVLKSLFNIALTWTPQSPERTMWSELKEAFGAYEGSDSRQQVHDRICAIFRQGQQTLDSKTFQNTFSGLVEENRSHLAPNKTAPEDRSARDPRALASHPPAPPLTSRSLTVPQSSAPRPSAPVTSRSASTSPAAATSRPAPTTPKRAPTTSSGSAPISPGPVPTAAPTASGPPQSTPGPLPTAPQAHPRRARLLRLLLCRPDPT